MIIHKVLLASVTLWFFSGCSTCSISYIHITSNIIRNLQHLPFQNRFSRTVLRGMNLNGLLILVLITPTAYKPWCKTTRHFTIRFARIFCIIDLRTIGYIYLIFCILLKPFSSRQKYHKQFSSLCVHRYSVLVLKLMLVWVQRFLYFLISY